MLIAFSISFVDLSLEMEEMYKAQHGLNLKTQKLQASEVLTKRHVPQYLIVPLRSEQVMFEKVYESVTTASS